MTIQHVALPDTYTPDVTIAVGIHVDYDEKWFVEAIFDLIPEDVGESITLSPDEADRFGVALCRAAGRARRAQSRAAAGR